MTPLEKACVHVLSRRAIEDAVHERGPGTFSLGYSDGSGFTVFFVGRSDSDLRADLLAWVDAPSRPRNGRSAPCSPWSTPAGPQSRLRASGPIENGFDTAYTHFTFCYATSANEAFEQECRDYHELGGSDQLDNAQHPEPPPDSPWRCPVHG